MTAVPNLPLSAGTTSIEIPQLGFGVWQVPEDEVVGAVTTAIETGYRSIDTARIYGNEEGTGEAIAKSGVARDELFVTTKVWNDDQGFDSTLSAFDASMKRLGLDTLDLYLIHWPSPKQDAYVDTWKALLRLREEGRVRAVGVCNFHVPHLQRLLDETGELPAINQIELHPYLQQTELREFHAANGQAILRWHLDIGNVVIPKSVTPSRIRENFDIFGFSLDADDLAAIATLERGHRTGPNPDEFWA
jgi:2,5-diketo-D-gluconate reductase A